MTDKEKTDHAFPSAHHSSPVLLVDDDQHVLESFSLMLNSAGVENIMQINDSRTVLQLLAETGASLIILDLFMPHISGTELLQEVRQKAPQIPVIIMTAANNIEMAVECLKNGAIDYLVKPVEKGRFLTSVKKALEVNELHNEVKALKDSLLSGALKHKEVFSSIITGCRKMFAVFQYVEAVAQSKQPLLITGETGVGKELIAQAAHNLSGRPGKFIAVNVAGLDDAMFSDTLFGHEKGAFTGAEKQRGGMIVQAEGGTLFLDEIGELNEASQVKLLRLLQEQVYYPLGSDIQKKTDCRIIAATNKDIKELSEKGGLRKDLYFRLCTHHLHIPPLRERKGDLPLLLDYFLEEAAKSMNKKRPAPPPELYTLLATYPFPGNIREMQAMIYDAVARHKSGILLMDSFKEAVKHMPSSLQSGLPLYEDDIQMHLTFTRFPTLHEIADHFILEAMKRSNGNQRIAASLLGITRQGLNKRLKKT